MTVVCTYIADIVVLVESWNACTFLCTCILVEVQNICMATAPCSIGIYLCTFLKY